MNETPNEVVTALTDDSVQAFAQVATESPKKTKKAKTPVEAVEELVKSGEPIDNTKVYIPEEAFKVLDPVVVAQVLEDMPKPPQSYQGETHPTLSDMLDTTMSLAKRYRDTEKHSAETDYAYGKVIYHLKQAFLFANKI